MAMQKMNKRRVVCSYSPVCAAFTCDASKAAATIMPPPIAIRQVNTDAPSATEDTLANTTSDIITIAVVCASKRAAPYCSEKFDTKKAPLKPSTQGVHAAMYCTTDAWVSQAPR